MYKDPDVNVSASSKDIALSTHLLQITVSAIQHINNTHHYDPYSIAAVNAIEAACNEPSVDSQGIPGMNNMD